MRKILFSLLLLILLTTSLYAQQSPSQQVLVSQKITAGGGGDIVNDTFTAGSDVNLSSHTGETGATWTLHPSYSGTITNDSTLDRIYLTSASAGAYYASGVPSSATYCVKADYRRVTQISNNISIILAFNTSADTGILLRANDTGAAFQWEVMDRTAGSNGTPVTSISNQLSIGGAAITMEICRSGTSITVTANGVQDTNLNFTTGITATDRAGVRISGTASSTTGIHLDNFIAH